MGQGSQDVYISQPDKLNVPNFLVAKRMALTSACAVGSLSIVTLFDASAITSPSFTMTAPKGPPPFCTLFSDKAIALRIISFCFMK